MGCCPSTPEEKQPVAIENVSTGMVSATTWVPPALGGSVPASLSGEPQKNVKQTSKIEVDSLHGNTFVNQYLIMKNLGSGSFGKVKLCLNVDDNCLYALKVVSKKQMRARLLAGRRYRGKIPDEELLREISVMKSLEHPHVVRLYEVIDDPTDDKLLMVMEYVEGGAVLTEEDLANPTPKLYSEDVARMHFRDLIKGLDYLHYQNVLHRDIKPENLLLTEEGGVKLSDFGSACHIPDGNDTMFDTAGTRTFFAPEMCTGEGLAYGGKKADIYAAGVVLYVLLFHKLPFEAGNVGDLFEKIRSEEPDYSSRTDISPDAIDLLKHLLEKNPEERLTIEEIMLHEWFTDRCSLCAIKSSRVLSVPTIDAFSNNANTALTPSINTVFQQIPDKKMKHFAVGSYIVKYGEKMTGLFLITKGLCVVTGDVYSEGFDSSDAEGDTDFTDLDTIEELPQVPSKSDAGKNLLSALSQPSGELDELACTELSRFKSLPRSEVVKGIGRRTTYQHSKFKELVEHAVADDTVPKASTPVAGSKSRRGPGSIIGLDMAVESSASKHSVKVVDAVDAIYVPRRALDDAFSGADSQLQLRLLVTKLQKIELLRDTVQKLADLHSDFLQMEQLRALVRNVSVHPRTRDVNAA